MSSPQLQRADGCSVTFSLIVATILVFSLFFVRQCISWEEAAPVDQHEQDERRKKVAAYKLEEGKFTTAVDNAHAEMNSSLKIVMQATLDAYAKPVEESEVNANSTEDEGKPE